jgi:hypothetical protein
LIIQYFSSFTPNLDTAFYAVDRASSEKIQSEKISFNFIHQLKNEKIRMDGRKIFLIPSLICVEDKN